jgi:hypothetical protein
LNLKIIENHGNPEKTQKMAFIEKHGKHGK